MPLQEHVSALFCMVDVTTGFEKGAGGMVQTVVEEVSPYPNQKSEPFVLLSSNIIVEGMAWLV